MVYALRPLLQELQTSKPGQTLQIPSSTIGIFERAAQLKSEGHSLPSVAKVLQEEMQDNSKATATPQSTSQEQPLQEYMQESASPPARVDSEWIRELLAEKDRRIADLEQDRDEWRDLALEFKRALPAPKERRSIFARIFKPIVVASKPQ